MKQKNIKLDVSASVHNRLIKFGNTFPQRVKALLACPEVITRPVISKMNNRMSITVTGESHRQLLNMMPTLGCLSISNVLESMLNTNPIVPMAYVLKEEILNEKVDSGIRVKKSDRLKLKAISDEEGIPIWMVIHNMIKESTKNEY